MAMIFNLLEAAMANGSFSPFSFDPTRTHTPNEVVAVEPAACNLVKVLKCFIEKFGFSIEMFGFCTENLRFRIENVGCCSGVRTILALGQVIPPQYLLFD